jgi:tetratricopeptide (TPR) repeat protein
MIVALLGSVLTAGCQGSRSPDESPHTPAAVTELVSEAAQRRAAGDVAGARATLEEALRQRPDDAAALVALGRLQLLDLSDPDAALATYRRAVKVAPQNADAHYGLGQQLHFHGDMPAARAEFQEALRLRPDWPHAAAWLGTTELESLPTDLPGAIRHLEGAAAADPQYAFARYELGRAFGRAERWKDAVTSLQAAVTLKPDYREAQYALGQSLEHLGRRDAARSALQRFHALDVARRQRRSRDVRRHAGALDEG